MPSRSRSSARLKSRSVAKEESEAPQLITVELIYEKYINPFVDFIMFHIPPGPRFIPTCYVVNFSKGATLPMGLFLMNHFDHFNFASCLIVALHGSYGLLWLLKHFVFPDLHWWTKTTLPSALLVILPCLVFYWGPMYLIISEKDYEIEPVQMMIAIFMYVFGVVLMMASDTQKFFVLQRTKELTKELSGKESNRLINDGWFRYCRNTNYVGEMLLYASFGVLTPPGSYQYPFMYLSVMWTLIFGSRWVQKEASFRRKGEAGAKYLNDSFMVLPFPLNFIVILYFLKCIWYDGLTK